MTRIAKGHQTEILVVEDSPTQAEQLRFILEKRGFTVSVASHGKEALSLLSKKKPDIIITDIIMPEMDGYELCKRLAADPSLGDIPVIFVTTLNDPTDVIKGLEVGANNFITKPYDEDHLISRIDYLIANKKLRDDPASGEGVTVLLSGQSYHITADRPHILDLLLSTYENSYRQNLKLMEAQRQLRELNELLEETVRERDAEIAVREKMEEALRKAHDELEHRVEERTAEVKRLADLISLTHDTIFVRDMDERITFWNKGAEETYGWNQKEALGKTPRALLHTQLEGGFESVKAALMKEDRWEGEIVHTKKDGVQVVVASRQVLRRDKGGNPVDVLEINIDITAQKRAEAALRQAQKMEAIGTLAGGIAHDFNNILAGIIGFAEMALDDTPDDDPVHRRLELVLKGGYRGRDLVKQILAFSRRTGQEKKVVRMSQIVEDMFKLLRPALPSTIEIKKRIHLAQDTITADPVQIHQVCMNLCTNAAHAMREKGGFIEIALSDAVILDEPGPARPGPEPGSYVVLSVKDTGCGMTRDVVEKIFDPFFTTKGPGEGTGLGLSVVHGIVKSHGGHIEVDSTPGDGSSFHVYLPKAGEGLAPPEENSHAIRGRQESILFVDDEELLVELNSQRLGSLGYKVVTSVSSTEALKIFEAEPDRFDLVITDYTMPNITGVDLAERILKIRPGIPIILSSGLNERVEPEVIESTGFRAFVAKTATKKELAEAIRRVLDGEEKARQ